MLHSPIFQFFTDFLSKNLGFFEKPYFVTFLYNFVKNRRGFLKEKDAIKSHLSSPEKPTQFPRK